MTSANIPPVEATKYITDHMYNLKTYYKIIYMRKKRITHSIWNIFHMKMASGQSG
jgi:hypothetical protein